MINYIPKIGDCVVAKRKNKTEDGPKYLLGPIVDFDEFESKYTIKNNEGEALERVFYVTRGEWDIRFLHKSEGYVLNLVKRFLDMPCAIVSDDDIEKHKKLRHEARMLVGE